MEWLNTLLQGMLLGGLYAMFAVGLSLMFGIMRLVNIAHGDFIVLASYLALMVVNHLGFSPLASLVIVVPVMFCLGYLLQRGLLNRTLGQDILPPLLVTFGLSIIVQNVLLQFFSADSQKLSQGDLEVASVGFGSLNVGIMPLMVFASALLIIGGLQLLFYKTALGRAFRATSDDQQTARLMGVNNAHIFGLAMALAMAVVSIAGVFLAIRTSFDPTVGPARLLYGFEAVIIGGLGSLWGTLAGGVILGIAQALGAKIDPGWQILAGHLVFLLILVVRPRGLFPRSVD
ncbi:branched-chain amino acid ABC transporter permease [Pseudomonas sp. PSB11]|jgi:branched-chain amino acid transport system permease protein|uniref:branched-chain amino acid ABC transporter permease n=1 Tax=Pseudomonas sp. PSB11 TaxID=2021969 RepID=UPI0016603246|nr:branched-chain amino acid ABC transporter permease [Pseudomonas sp. PSB11]MBD0678619.1 branched-chain amino acid ABC transporter permease [Pseudomonas sp. PSB11]MDP9688107.1 branched-chain amino acid transport system permease protein [Pseudomonas mohnii]